MKNTYSIIIVLISFIGFFSIQANERLIVSYTIPVSEHVNALANKKIQPSSGLASNYQSGEGIDKTYDGDYNTIYHSSYSSTKFPITLTYNFRNVDQIDYLVYHPRQDGHSNGNFIEVDVYVTAGGDRTLTGSYDFGGKSTASRIDFPGGIINPTRIEVIVKSGTGDNSTGYACCSEMEFYKLNNEGSDFLSLFKDGTATTLKPEVTLNDIRKIPNLYLREVATKIYDNNYSLNFRSGIFKPYLNLNKLGDALIAYAYNKYENPTGIYFPKGKHVIIASNIEAGKSVTLLIPDYRFTNEDGEYRGNIISRSYSIGNGINVIDVQDWDGLGYISYFSNDPSAESNVKIHFVNGIEHGYFDVTKHTNSDWVRLLNNATDYPAMDAVGRYCQLTFPVEDYKQYSQGKGVELVNVYDSIVTYQQRFIGLEKYNKRPKNRILCRVNYTYFMFKDGDGASFEKSTLSYVINPDKVLKQAWGMGHEIGHIHQMKFVSWAGMGEVSVNFPNIYINYMYPSATSTNMSRQKVQRAKTALYEKGIAHASYQTGDYNMFKLAPFAVLYHYMRHIKGNSNYYADLYESLRNSTENTDDWNTADFEYYFVKMACDAAKLNLVPYFEKWGFLYCTDINGRAPFEVEDYSNGYYELSSSKVAELNSYIQSKGYATPDVNSIMSTEVINQMTNIDK